MTHTVKKVLFDADGPTVLLADGCKITTPLSWYPRLATVPKGNAGISWQSDLLYR